MKLRSTLITATLVASTLTGTAFVATPAVADSSKTCNVSAMASKIKGKVPVIVVHGLMGNGDAWTQSNDGDSMLTALKKIKGVYVDEPFDYSSTNTRWVTDDNIGPRLARRIDCLAQASGRDPAVIGHSMGGLTARLASSLKVDGRSVGDKFGMLITLGTPNLGSGLANIGTDFIRSLCPARTVLDHSLCDFSQISALKGLRENSEEIKNLPWMPRDVPVLALAGDVSVHAKIFNADVTMDTEGDLVVSKNSALQDIRTTSAGGGSKSFACTMEVGFQLPECWHSALTSNRDVIQTTVDAVTHYVKATAPKPPANTLSKVAAEKWTRHASQFTVSKDGTASMLIGYGASGADGCGPWCTFNAKLKVIDLGNGTLRGTYTEVWFSAADSYEDSSLHVVAVPASITDAWPHVGDAATIVHVAADDELRISGLGDPGSYWCGPRSTDPHHHC
jgi:pimeloyl-ACP methyl ester carboxylesterase